MEEQFPNNDDFEHEKVRRVRRAMYSRSLSRRLHRRPRRVLQSIRHNLSEDWQEKEEGASGKKVAPWGIMLTRNLMKWVLGIAIGFFAVSVGIFIYFFTFGSGGLVAAPGNIDITVNGPLSVVGGEPVELQITVLNRNKTELKLADLIIEYPEGTRSPSDFVTDLSRQRISLGSIESGGRRQGTVSAVFVGRENTRDKVHVELEYRVADSSAIFVSETDFDFSFTASPISVSIDANSETVSGQRVTIIAHISSNVDAILRDVLVEAQYPFGFTPESVEPDPIEEGKMLWELGDLAPDDRRTIRISGTLEGQQGDDRAFRFLAGTRLKRDAESIDVVLTEVLHRMAVARPFIGLDIGLNKQSGSDPNSVLPGETVSASISWVNNLSSAITNAVIVASLSGLSIDGRTVRTTDGFYRSTDSTILWDSSTTKGALENLSPGERGTVGFSFEVPAESELLNERNSTFTITVHAAGRRTAQSGVPETLQATAKRDIKLASNVQFIVQGFYHSNPFGSVGPLPPKVNEETTYALVFTVANTSNRLENVKLKGRLPTYVRWIGVHSPAGEDLEFNSSDGTVEWNIGTIGAGVGVSGVPPRQVAFAVGVTPSASQIGQEPPMIQDLVLTGVDTFIDRAFTRDHIDVTTNLLDDVGFSTEEAQVVLNEEQ